MTNNIIYKDVRASWVKWFSEEAKPRRVADGASRTCRGPVLTVTLASKRAPSARPVLPPAHGEVVGSRTEPADTGLMSTWNG
ncbi:unnamed protein product [Arctia plantaginis]|uniref:Uncharacterized protein n=1 Tax=Arctia plantaginis TaxID=874455 RepID=A0A8S0YSN2_ARCPL|nr:unnamed protein product [Arctia plantaginis]